MDWNRACAPCRLSKVKATNFFFDVVLHRTRGTISIHYNIPKFIKLYPSLNWLLSLKLINRTISQAIVLRYLLHSLLVLLSSCKYPAISSSSPPQFPWISLLLLLLMHFLCHPVSFVCQPAQWAKLGLVSLVRYNFTFFISYIFPYLCGSISFLYSISLCCMFHYVHYVCDLGRHVDGQYIRAVLPPKG